MSNRNRKDSDCMAKREDIESKATELIMPIIESCGFELVDLEYVKEGSSKYLRAYIDKPAELPLTIVLK